MWFSVTGDLRFLSHHDMMRLMERAAARAGLPLKYSQGFNPRPKLSLAAPRPVGVAAQRDLLVLRFDGVSEANWASKLNGVLPAGVDIRDCQPLAGRKPPQIKAATYETPAEPPLADTLEARLDELADRDSWPVPRRVKGPRGRRGETKTIDIKPHVRDLAVDNGRLKFTIIATAGGSARPAEVLQLLGLPAGEYLAGLTRTTLDVDLGVDDQQ